MPPRRKGLNIPGHAHELTFSCSRRFAFLESDRTRRRLADAVTAARVKHDLAVWAFVMMPDHAQIILHPVDAITTRMEKGIRTDKPEGFQPAIEP